MIVLLPNGPSVHSQVALLLTPNSHKKVARDSKHTTTFTLFTCDGKTTQKVSRSMHFPVERDGGEEGRGGGGGGGRGDCNK